MTYVAPQSVVAGDKYNASAHNIIVDDIIDLNSRVTSVSSNVTSISSSVSAVSASVSAVSASVSAVSASVSAVSASVSAVSASVSAVSSNQNIYARAKRTAGNLSTASTTWIDFDTGLDLVLRASAGDVIEVAASGFTNNATSTSLLDVVTIVSGNPVNSFAVDGPPSGFSNGIGAWMSVGGSATTSAISGSFFRTLVAGDISSGTVTLRLRRRVDTPVSKTILADSNIPFEWFARNHGPVTP